MKIVKKDGTLSEYNDAKIINAISKSAERVLVKFTDEEVRQVCDKVKSRLPQQEQIIILQIHRLVETALDEVNPKVAKSYRDYRNYKQDFVHILDKVFKKSQTIRYIGDRDNANTDSALVPTQRSLIYNELNGELYKKFFLNVEERAAMNEGYIYIHDRYARLDTMN